MNILYTMNPGAPKIDADSFQFKYELAWIGNALKISAPVLVQNILLPPPTGLRMDDVLVFQANGRTTLVDAELFAQGPQVTITGLYRELAIPVPAEIPQYAPPPVPAPPVVVPVAPTVLVGPKQENSETYLSVPGDTSPDGTEYEGENTVGETGKWIKNVTHMPFGSMVYWVKIG